MTAPTGPEPPVLKRSGFSLCGDEWGVSGHPRVDGKRLHNLLKPERLLLQRDRKAAEKEAKKLFKKPFFAAQLRYYGIEFPAATPAAQLRALLLESVEGGKCKKIPASVVDIERSMRRDYRPKLASWKKEVKAWEEGYQFAQKQLDSGKTARKGISGKGGQAAGRASKKRPLSPDKEAPSGLEYNNPKKRLNSRQTARKSAGWEMPGVDYSNCPGPVRVGGNASYDDGSATYNDKKVLAGRQRQTAVKSVGGNSARASANAPSRNQSKVSQPSYLGSYSVKCEAISDGWDNADDLTIDICPGSNRDCFGADFGFGIFEGTIILSHSKASLRRVVPQYRSDGDEDEDAEPKSKKRGKAVTAAPKPGKKASDKALPRRLYLALRGRETGEGQIYPTPESGYIEFTDSSLQKFKGVVDLPFVGNSVAFEGFKVHDSPLRRPSSWSTFSEEAYEYARVARWR